MIDKTKRSLLSRQEIERIAGKAKLKLSSEEIKKFKDQLSKVLDYMEILNKADINNIEPTTQITGLKNVTRSDATGQSLSADETLSQAKDKDRMMFKVKAIL